MPFPQKNITLLLIITSITIVYVCNLFIDVMEVDAAQYASISLEMLKNKSYLQVFHRNADYLDKPPMLFWLAVISFKIFGVYTWSYKFLPVLIIIAGIFATYKLGEIFYNKLVGTYSALILATAQALFLITNDVRTDGILLGFSVLAIWQYVEYEKKNNWFNLVFSAIFLAMALMAKGPIALIIFLSGIGTNILIHKKWKELFNLKWVLFFMIIGLLLIPMSYGLYQQFDLHPEKTVYGLTGPSGLRFFYWTQSFGRITGDIYWENNTSYFTFLHTFLWDFQPWALLAIIAFIYKLSRIKGAILGQSNEEFISFGAFLFPFIALSLSKFKLPHYIFPLFPFMAIMLGHFLVEIFKKLKFQKALLIFQFVLLHVFYLALVISYIYFFAVNYYIVVAILVLGFVLFYYSFFQKSELLGSKILQISVITSIIFSFNLSIYFYPQLLDYQSESVLGKEIIAGKYDKNKLYLLNTAGHSLEFYGDKIFENIKIEISNTLPIGSLVFTDEIGKNQLISTHKFQVLKTYEDYPVTQLNIIFLNKSKRESRLKYQYLVEKVNEY